MIDPYQQPIPLKGSRQRRGITTVAMSFISSLILVPIIFSAVGWFLGSSLESAPRIVFHPKFLLAIVAFSCISALIVYPARKWHPKLPSCLSPVVGFALLIAFLELR